MKIKNIWLISLFIKLVLAIVLPLSPDEAYYWVWSKHLQLSYFDHPPMVAWLFKMGSVFENFGGAVRIPGVVLGHFTLFFIYLIGRKFITAKVSKWLMVVLLFSPLLGFGSLIITPDLPVLFFYVLSFYIFEKWVKKPDWKNAALLGSTLGLGFCAKYHMALFVPFAVIYIIASKQIKKFLHPTLLLIVATGLIFSSPVLIWNYQNDFESFRFQINHGLAKGSWEPYWTYSYLLGQILIIFPTILWLAIKASFRKELLAVSIFAWGPLGFFLMSSFKGLVEGNWPIIALPFIYLLAIAALKKKWPILLPSFLWTMLFLVVASQFFVPWMPAPPFKVQEMESLLEASSTNNDYKPMYGGTYQIASSLWFYSKTPVYKLNQMSRRDFFDSLENSKPLDNIFYVTMNIGSDLPKWVDQKYYKVDIIKKINDLYQIVRVEKL